MKVLNSDDDWYDVTSDGEAFTAFGDASKLQFLINLFKEFTENESIFINNKSKATWLAFIIYE